MKTDLKHLPPYKQDEIRHLVRLLAESKGVEMVILFGSYARGTYVEDRYVEKGILYEYRSDYDLLVVTTHDDLQKKFRIEEKIVKQLTTPGYVKTTPNLIFHSIRHLNKSLAEGNYFFRDIKKEGIVLHNTGKFELQIPKILTPKESQQKAQDYFNQWFESANTFFKGFKFYLAEKDFHVAAFQLHQATERFFSTILLVFTDYRPKEHDLGKLDLRVRNCDPRFVVFPQNTKAEIHCFELLKKAYIDARYKMDEYTITEEELTYLAEKVNQLKELTSEICQEKIRQIGLTH